MSVNKQARQKRKLLLTTAAFFVAVLVPVAAFAIPGSGDFIPVESPSGRDITALYNLIAKICVVILIIVEGVLAAAIFKFRRRSDDEQPDQVHGNLKLELTWTLAAIILQVFIGFKTIDVMFQVLTVPQTQMTVEAIAHQWDWEFRYPDQGGMIHEDLVIPAHTDVKLEVTSQDVIHALFIPELGIKVDAVPGRHNYYWLNADGPINSTHPSVRPSQEPTSTPRVTTRPDWWSYFALDFMPTADQRFYTKPEGDDAVNLERRVDYLAASRDASSSPYRKYHATEYRGMCAELCGKDHWNMYFRTVAMTPADFERWVHDKKTGGNGEVDGEQLFTKNCTACHGADGKGTPGTYPPLVGSRFTTDPANKRRHIHIVLNGLDQELKVLGETYNGVMQPFGQKLNDEEVAALVTHERTTWGNDGGKVTAELVAEVRKESGLPPFPAGGAEPVPDDELMDVGERVYEACVSCHGKSGEGLDSAPNLAQSPTVMANIDESIRLLVNGADTDKWPTAQPPMGRSMSDRQLAGVLTYIRKSFGNEASAVQPEEVGRIRDELSQ